MKHLSVSLLAASLLFAGNVSAQTSGYYVSDRYAGQDDGYSRNGEYGQQGATYDYARVVRVDPVIGGTYNDRYTRQNTQCSYRQADDVYVGEDGYYGSDDRYSRSDDYDGRDGYDNDDGYRDGGSQAGRTVATVIGGIAGAVLGSKVGDGSGRYVGTAVGSMVGGMAGRSIYDSSQRNRQVTRRGTVRVCDPVPANSGDYRDEDERLQGYDVTYEYANRTYRTRTNYHPGDRIRVRVDVQPE